MVACNPLRTVPHISKLDRDGDGTPCETLLAEPATSGSSIKLRGIMMDLRRCR
ncbi:excalibur calcium-binding domain-containing protein [Mesorhizobium sp.]|uniref:excalibur calcium-binding domain-containing protein n=1 Tax=Mesorhizobium sp. TaxID=1871066 RepID=UPI000FE805C4|nr:MAG: excalibur calcium-binding domain-containing protein [Mesorhizobium sp.]RWK67319.1 MAG: excalibur calcium-binding domain-containing protein [Mesorhizobium sp.]RWK74821.1 MAG: excalibur calcium-binding domain-containing protein [Mesorhizobium sp.]RWK77886.1 MAG: excalibur calcium-binding domain-containing protein [Mesorhizobium sp.]RWL03296.1 MAG: excalibur calcium-binding domain-containing protein [Mesorhizobium sp.]